VRGALDASMPLDSPNEFGRSDSPRRKFPSNKWLSEKTWPMGAVRNDEWSYIRREGDVSEELFHTREDAKQQRNRAGDPGERSTLERMRGTLDGLSAGPLLPNRFN
jgi:hypothetical protein